MPLWWGKSSSKDVDKRKSKDNASESPNLLSPTEKKGIIRSVWPRRRRKDVVSGKGSRSRAASRSPSPISNVTRCHSFADRSYSQPLPTPGPKCSGWTSTESKATVLEKRGRTPLVLPISASHHIASSSNASEADDLATISRSHSPEISVSESSLSSSSCQSSIPKSHRTSLRSASHSSLSSPCKSPLKIEHSEPTAEKSISVLQISGQSSVGQNITKQLPLQQFQGSHEHSPIPNSRTNSPGASLKIQSGSVISVHQHAVEMALQFSVSQAIEVNKKCSRGCSPARSPRTMSPGPKSRGQSGSIITPHPWPPGHAPDSPTGQTNEVKTQSHRLPLPPTTSNASPSSPTHSVSYKIPTTPQNTGNHENTHVSHWKKGKLIGRGTFGHVYIGFNSESGEMCAMKEVTLFSDNAESKESTKHMEQEISLLSMLHHPNIVQYYGSEMIDDRSHILLEYVSGGSIHKLLQDYGNFGELAIRNYTRQILSGLAYLHSKGTVHRDIKGANILVDPNGRVKLADFGMAKHITNSGSLSLKGSPYWMAPEVITNTDGYSTAVDIWSLGCTILEMATSKPPWSQYEGIAAMFKIGHSKELPVIPSHLSDVAKDFIKLCLQREPSKRPLAAKLLQHPFVKNLETSTISTERLKQAGNTTAMILKDAHHARNQGTLDMEGFVTQRLKAAKSIAMFSKSHLKNVSCPVSPIGSPFVHSRPLPDGTKSSSPISSPVANSGSSTPVTVGNSDHLLQETWSPYIHEGHCNMPRLSPCSLDLDGFTGHDPHELRHGKQPNSHSFWGFSASESHPVGGTREPYDVHQLLLDQKSK